MNGHSNDAAPAAGRAACLIGWPAAHSRSPLIHRHWLKTLGIAGEYRLEEIAPDAFGAFVGDLKGHGYIGANVTIPHKEQVLEIARCDERAHAVGAANTLWYEDGVLRATNTDVEGFIDNLDECAPGWDRTDTALVLGAGGAARAVLFGLLDRGFARIYLANRTRARADLLAREFGPRIVAIDWSEAERISARAGLLVNTTALGMEGQHPLTFSVAQLPDHAVVTDLVYTPLHTDLLRAAEQRELRTVDGVGMLLYQAVRGFHLWFGSEPKVTAELRALVVADLLRQECALSA